MEAFLFTREIGAEPEATLRGAQNSRLAAAVDDGSMYATLETVHYGPVNSVDVDCTGSLLVSGGGDAAINIWSLHDVWEQTDLVAAKDIHNANRPMAGIKAHQGHKYGISNINWWPFDNGLFTTSSFDGTVKIWDTVKLEEACSFEIGVKVFTHQVSPVASHCLLAVGGGIPSIRLCDLKSGSYTHSLISTHQMVSNSVLALAWSPVKDNILVSGHTDGRILLWDIRSSRGHLSSLDMNRNSTSINNGIPSGPAHIGVVNALKFTHDSRTLVSSGHDEKLRVWDMVQGTNRLVSFGPHIRNRTQTNLRLAITNELDDISPTMLWYPSDDGKALLFSLYQGGLLKRVRLSKARLTSIVNRPGTQEYYVGCGDGQINILKPYLPDPDEDNEERKPSNVLDDIHKTLYDVPVTLT